LLEESSAQRVLHGAQRVIAELPRVTGAGGEGGEALDEAYEVFHYTQLMMTIAMM
jgi:hypothetical protein